MSFVLSGLNVTTFCPHTNFGIRDTESHPATIAREYTAPALSTTDLVLSR